MVYSLCLEVPIFCCKYSSPQSTLIKQTTQMSVSITESVTLSSSESSCHHGNSYLEYHTYVVGFEKNIFTVIAICAAFIATYLPGCVWYARKDLNPIFAEILWSVAFVSVWINPFIHFIMNQSFRQFTINKLCGKSAGADLCVTDGGPPTSARLSS